MTSPVLIELARQEDIRLLPDIEQAASLLFSGTAHEAEVQAGTLPVFVLEACRANGLLWVARLKEIDQAVGFAAVLDHGETAHLHEMSVDAACTRKGIGSRLLRHVLHALAQRGYHAVTLSTYRDVPWNARFYARFGFRLSPPEAWSDALMAIRQKEEREGLDTCARVLMEIPLSGFSEEG